jgi:5-methyltetrahydrofolate--homocysteine methyltransferase
MMGISPTDMVNTLIDAGAELIGANCGNGIADMIGIVEEIRKANAEIPVLVHANAGMPHYHDGQTVFPERPDEMANLVPKIIAAGANVIGGCCGTTPGHICRVREMVDKK